MGSLDDIWDEKPQSSVEPLSPKVESSSPAPLPHQYVNQRTGTGSTWNSTARGGGTMFPEPIYEEPETHYTAPPMQPPSHQGPQPRTSPPVPQAQPDYSGIGLPLRNQYPYGFTQQHPSTPQQPQRIATGQVGAYRLSTPPDESPSRPRRRDTGDTSRMGLYR